MNLREELNKLDHKALQEDTNYYDLVSLYDAVNLTDEEKEELAKKLDKEDAEVVYDMLWKKFDKNNYDCDDCYGDYPLDESMKESKFNEDTKTKDIKNLNKHFSKQVNFDNAVKQIYNALKNGSSNSDQLIREVKMLYKLTYDEALNAFRKAHNRFMMENNNFLDEDIEELEEEVEKKITFKVTGGKCSTKYVYDTQTNAIYIDLEINSIPCRFYFSANHGTHCVDGVDCDTCKINDKRVEPVTITGGTHRSYALNVPGSIMKEEPLQNQKDFSFTGQYYNTKPAVRYFKNQLKNLLLNEQDIFSKEFLDSFEIPNVLKETINDKDEYIYCVIFDPYSNDPDVSVYKSEQSAQNAANHPTRDAIIKKVRLYEDKEEN